MSKKKKRVRKVITVAAASTFLLGGADYLGKHNKASAASSTNTSTVNVAAEATEATEASKVSVSKFTMYSNTALLDAYNSKFMVPTNQISIANNGGVYSTSVLANVFDGDLNTHWETGKPNSDTFTNEVVFTFNEATTLNRVIYAPRLTGAAGKGFPLEFEIQGAKTDDGEFTVVATGSYSSNVRDAIEVQFDSTEFKKLKFVFKNANSDWAAASEFMFYTQDELAEKVDRLFTDSKKNKISDEFNTAEKLEALEKEVEGHPLKADFMESIEDAKAVLAMEEIEPSTAETQAFKYYDNEAYKEQFMVPLTNIKKFSNNGGHYASSELKYAFDGDASTYWETKTSNSDSFKNTIEVEFKEAVEINRFVYGARPSDRKGFISGFDLYISPTSEGDTYQLVSSGGYTKVSGLVEAKFDTAKAKRVKLVATDSDQNWATLSELSFFKEDTLANKVDSLFTDGTMSKLTSEFDTLAEINALEDEVKTHPLYEIAFKEKFDLAKKVADGEVELEGRVITVEQNGDMVSHAKNNLKFGFGNNNQPIGIAAQPGDKVTIYVEAASGTKYLPQIVFSQQEGSFANWQRSVQLQPGKNEITVPAIATDSWYNHEVVRGGTMYIYNPYTPEQQGDAPIIRVEGGERIPFLTKDTDPEEFKAFLIDYKERLDADKAAHPDLADRELIDVIEVASDHLVFTGTATGAYQAYITDGYDPAKTVLTYNKYMQEIFDFYGLNGDGDDNDPKAIRENIRLMQPFGYMYAYTNHTGVQGDVMVSMLKDGVYSWGVAHEIGHRMDVSARLYGESTNNMIAMQMGVLNGQIDNRIPYSEIYTTAFAEDRGDFRSKGYFTRLGAFWQLEMYYPGYWAELNSLYRERDISAPDEATMQKYLVELSSEVVGEDLSEFFERHAFDVTDEVKENVSKYPKSKKAWYLNNSVINYKGNGFQEGSEIDVNITVNESENTNTFNFTANKTASADLLGYEIIRDGQAIGFTSSTSFTDKDIDPTQNYTYEVVAYDKKLNELTPVEVNSFKPTISVPEQLTLKLHQEFNELEYVKAYNYKGEDITDTVKVHSSNVDVTKKGNYQVTFTVTNQEVTETKTLDVTVTSDFDYVSDVKAKSYAIDWGGLKLDKAPEGSTITLLRDGKDVTYKKGIGAHANSQIVYDIEGKEYDYFESYIGIDQAMKGNNSSATFEVWVDNEKVYTSGTFGSGTDNEYIKVPIKEGAKQIKLVTTDAGSNGNTADHTVWADAKFIKDSSKPVITVQSEATKVGQPIDIEGEYTATDVEDGDLTNKVTVTGVETVDFNKAGDYKISYTVKDSDGNEVTEIRTISVVDMRDFKHLSDYNWSSESHTYAAPVKDKATSGNTLRLTAENGEVIWYQKGIGAHSTSTIVYDLTDKEAAYFSSYVGVDRQMYNTAGSVEFKVYVDGVEKYTSGVMSSTDAQKYVEVSLAGAKELKLVVTDGGNGIGSDHATWADAKLHYANDDQSAEAEETTPTEPEAGTEETTPTEPEAGTEETTPTEPEAGTEETTPTELEAGTEETTPTEPEEGTVETADVEQLVVIEDEQLAQAIKTELGVDGDLTVADLQKLTKLSAKSLSIQSLKGLENATNLVSLDVTGNAILDFSPLKDLEKLTTLTTGIQFREMGELTTKDGIVTIKNEAINKQGETVTPYEVNYYMSTGDVSGKLTDAELKENAESFQVDLTGKAAGWYWVNITYNVDGNIVSVLYAINNVSE